MSLSRKIAAALDDRGDIVNTPATVSTDDGRHRLSLEVDLASAVGVRCRSLEFSPLEPAERSLGDLRAWGDRLASRVTYLMEPWKVVEADALGGEVLLRSQGPTPRNGRRAFYEVRIDRAGTLRLARVSFDEESRRREADTFQFTREVLERLADDFAQTAG